jgi:dipeptidyl-peptidase-4
MRRTLAALAALLVALSPAPARAQDGGAALTIDRIFASPELSGDWFGGARWLEDGGGYTRLEPSTAVQGGVDIVRFDPETNARTVLVPARALVAGGKPLEVEDYAWSPDASKLLVYTNSARVWRANTRGDYWVLDRASGSLRKLGGPDAAPSTLMFATFSPDGQRVAYVRENNLYAERLSDGTVTRLTSDGSRTIINGTFDWVYEEELGLRNGFRWSPDSRSIAYWQLDASGVRDFLLLNNTDSLYSYVVPVQYPKAGTTNSAGRVGVVPADGGPTRWMDVPGDPRNNYIARMEWGGTADAVFLQHLNRLQNTLTVRAADPATGAVRTVLTERDSAWVDVVDDWTWLDGGRRFLWVSERDGWRHVYTVSRDGRETRLVTPGAFDVVSIEEVDEKGGWLYYIASPDNPTQRYLYRTRLDGRGRAERLSPAGEAGTHGYTVAPGGRYAFHTYSSFDVPPVTDLVRLPSHARVRVLVDNAELKARVAALRRGESSFFRVDVGEGTQLDGWMIKPPGFDPSKKYPVLMYVYGEPWGQTAVDEWGGDNYLWHQMLAQQGYVVISVDNRGTPSPRGRAWRKAIYRRIGVLNARDQAEAAKAIGKWDFVDPARMGIWGWSGGGASTLGALFRHPEVFALGMAVAPVTDLHYYDTIYEERYMGLPQENGEDYRQGSSVNFAANLRADLLVVHGTGDDNVHYQNTEALVNALVAANKPFTMMSYPNRTHGIYEGRNTTRHLYSLLTRYLTENLPANPASR